MARKATVTHEMILNSAFELMREEGVEQVTARKLAAKAGCSTQPIFRLYENMDQLLSELYEKAVERFDSVYQSFPELSDVSFVNLGLCYISFAEKEKNMFRLLFMSPGRGKSMYELLSGKTGAVGKEINKAKAEGVKDPGDLFMKMWIFVHGAACMCLTGDYDLSEADTLKLLVSSHDSFTGNAR